ncbi:hypothetical protein E1162_16145 [Rhodobacteraceae bacterium RKSG542]|uniref:fumarylacetoacetate hydrolase family protein n=1 Tax=Pseudovibrio flavus TaxID=2529854 RepID=UPI0012BC9C0D|nr:fumarylacetoacetate hydrolase family protein [Pseudovibrio flavus]MTI18778.1 hypothetical protein [Pseudovibrio flavus]
MHAVSQAYCESRKSAELIAVENYPSEALSRDEAFQIQEEVAGEFGPVAAWKVAFDPEGTSIYAPIFKSDVKESGATFFENGAGIPLGIEVELAFELAKDITEAPASDEELKASISRVLMVIELVGSRLADPAAADLNLKIADNLTNMGFIIGDEVKNVDPAALEEQTLKLVIDGKTIIDGATKCGTGNPFNVFKAAAAKIGGHIGGFKAGQIVTCGTFSGCTFYPVGSKVEAEFPVLGTKVSAVI